MLIDCIVPFSTVYGDLYGVVEDSGKFYERYPPELGDNWLGTAELIGQGGWASFRHLFFHPDGTLYGVYSGTFYKAPPPLDGSAVNWLSGATIIGYSGWNDFQFLFFDPNGVLYGVRFGMVLKGLPPTSELERWTGTAHIVGSSGWGNVFKFLFFDPEGMLYGVENGKFHKGLPPTDATDVDTWLGSSTLISDRGWGDFQFLFFMSDGDLYAVRDRKFHKWSRPIEPRAQISDNWLASSTLIGGGGWQVFKFLMAPLLQ